MPPIFVCSSLKFTLVDTQMIVNVFAVHMITQVDIRKIIPPRNSTTDISCHPSLSHSRCLDDTLVTMVMSVSMPQLPFNQVWITKNCTKYREKSTKASCISSQLWRIFPDKVWFDLVLKVKRDIYQDHTTDCPHRTDFSLGSFFLRYWSLEHYAILSNVQCFYSLSNMAWYIESVNEWCVSQPNQRQHQLPVLKVLRQLCNPFLAKLGSDLEAVPARPWCPRV